MSTTSGAQARPAATPGPPVPGTTRGWRPALRIARRMVRRNLGRSSLVAALVAVPVAGATLVDGLYRTFDAPERAAYEAMGDGDALIEVTPFLRMQEGFFPSRDVYFDGQHERDPGDVDLAAALPSGTTLVPAPTRRNTRVERGDGTTDVSVLSADLGHPLTENRARLDSGTWPERPDEVLINEALANRLDLLDGNRLREDSTVTINDGPTLSVTGIGLDPFSTSDDPWNTMIFARPDSAAVGDVAGPSDWRTGRHGGITYIAEFPAGTDVDALWPELAAEGIATTPREAYLDPERYNDWATGAQYVDATTIATAGLVTLIVGLGLLEVVLLAGAAFAVSARRQVRDLGLITSNGGTATHVRRIMYAQGAVLGVLGAAAGLAVGGALTIGGKPLWERISNSLIEGWHFGAGELAAAAGVGVLSGLAAAYVPARGAARMRPIDALAQRFRATPLTAQLPRVGLALIALGAGGALLASRLAAADLEAYAEAIEAAAGTGEWVAQPSGTNLYVAAQLIGAVVAVAGLIMTISFLITMVARRMRRWPVAARYAARDAARHRHRTTPAVAAIMIVVASASGLSIGLAGMERVDELRYTPSLPDGVMSVTRDLDVEMDNPEFSTHLEAIAGVLPSAEIIEYANPGQVLDDGVSTWFDQVHVWRDGTVANAWVGIGTPELIELVYGEAPDQPAMDALDAGAMIVPTVELADADGDVSIEVLQWTFDGSGGGAGEVVDHIVMPAHVIDLDGPAYERMPTAFVSEQFAAQRWDVVTDRAYITFGDSATVDDLDAARDIAETFGYATYVENGCLRCGTYANIGLALTAGAALVTLVGVGVVVALAGAEGRADMATMAAVGASPRRRRAVAGWQALVVACIGTALGLALGAYFAFMIWPAIGAPEFLVPWPTIGVIAIAVPAIAAGSAILLTRSRLPMVRRIE